jgi:RNA polymerase sigma factor (sigma-70 family)
MTNATTPSMVRQIESLFDGGSVAGLSDRQLIERFVDRRDPTAEAAFAALVTRHGPMVLGVCRQLLGDRHHAEDAFQAIFLILARKAGSIRDPDRLSAWLYGVAVSTARRSQARLIRQRRGEQGEVPNAAAFEPTAPPADQPAIDREQAQALHDEIDRLPGAFRLPVVLCYFEGLTLDEAARRLSWPEGTLRSRLARAREKLRRGLTRRGVIVPAAVLAATLDARPASASVSSPLCDLTARAAMNFAAGHAATALAREILRAMFVSRLKRIATTLLLLAAVATGAGYWTYAAAMKDEPRGRPAAPQSPIAPKPDDAIPKPAPGRMFVVGRVLDPHGKPLPNATIMAYARSKALGQSPSMSRMYAVPIGDDRADGSGRFHLDAPRIGSSEYDTFGAVALASGYGAAWVELDPDAERPAADIILRPERVIQGRLFDLQGRPVRGVAPSVRAIARVVQPNGVRAGLERVEGVFFWPSRTEDLPAWPQAAPSDDQGRFALRGVGQGLRAYLVIDDPHFASQQFTIDTDGTPDAQPLNRVLEPAKIIKGRITYADSGKPVPRALLMVNPFRQNGVGGGYTEFETDDDGWFRMTPPSSGGYNIPVYPPAGQPYLTAHKRLDWPKGAIEQSFDLALPRGVLIHGKVIEEGSGKPVPRATIRYMSYADQQDTPRSGSTVLDTAADGSFQIGAVPNPGYLSVMGPSDDYVLQDVGDRGIGAGFRGRPNYSHANIFLDLKPGGGDTHVDVVLRRGATVTGRIIGPDGQPVRETWMIGRTILQPSAGPWRIWMGDHHDLARDGRFEIHGLAPDTETPVHFLEPKGKLGATAHLSGKAAASGPIVVRLEPCGTARARLVDPDGKPLAGRPARRLLTMVVTPGPPRGTPIEKAGPLDADEDLVDLVDPINHPGDPVADAEGHLSIPALIPGATYRFIDRTTRDQGGPKVRKEFAVKPGETLDLGDLRIEKPPAP